MEGSSKFSLEQQPKPKWYPSYATKPTSFQLSNEASQLEETLQNFIKATHSGLEQVNKNHEILTRNQEASIKNLVIRIGQLSRQLEALPSSSRGFTGYTIDNPKNETCKVVEMDIGLITRKEEVEKN